MALDKFLVLCKYHLPHLHGGGCHCQPSQALALNQGQQGSLPSTGAGNAHGQVLFLLGAVTPRGLSQTPGHLCIPNPMARGSVACGRKGEFCSPSTGMTVDLAFPGLSSAGSGRAWCPSRTGSGDTTAISQSSPHERPPGKAQDLSRKLLSL